MNAADVFTASLTDLWAERQELRAWARRPENEEVGAVRESVFDRIASIHSQIADRPPETVDEILVKLRLLREFDAENNPEQETLLESRLIRTMLAGAEKMVASP